MLPLIAFFLLVSACLGTRRKYLWEDETQQEVVEETVHSTPFIKDLISYSTLNISSPNVSTPDIRHIRARKNVRSSISNPDGKRESSKSEADSNLARKNGIALCCSKEVGKAMCCSENFLEGRMFKCGNIRYTVIPFAFMADQLGWWALIWIYKDYFWFCLMHITILALHTIMMTLLVYDHSQKHEKFWNTFSELFKVNILLQTYRTARKGGSTYILSNVIMRWQPFYSIPFLILSYNFGLKELPDNTSEWHGIIIIAAIFSSIVITEAQLIRDKYGFTRPAWNWELAYMVWRMIELLARVKLWAIVGVMTANYAFVAYMFTQLVVVFAMKVQEKSLLLLFYDNDFRSVEKEQKKQQIWTTLEDSLLSLFFFSLPAVPSCACCNCCCKETEEKSDLRSSESDISFYSMIINIFKLAEPFIMVILIHIRYRVWTEDVSTNPEEIQESQLCISVIQAALGLTIWLVLTLVIFLTGAFSCENLRAALSDSPLYLYNYGGKSKLNILESMILQKKCVTMTPEENQLWVQKGGLKIENLIFERKFSPYELAELGFALFDILRTSMDDKKRLMKETRRQLYERARLEPGSQSVYNLRELYEHIFRGSYLSDDDFEEPAMETREQVLAFQNACSDNDTRLVLWRYRTQTRVDDKDQGKAYAFSAFDLEYTHELFDPIWTNWEESQKRGKHRLVEENQAQGIVHVLMIPPCGEHGRLEFLILEPIGDNPDYYLERDMDMELEMFSSLDLERDFELPLPQVEMSNEYEEVEVNMDHPVELTTQATNQSVFCCVFWSILSFPCIWGGYINTWGCCCRGGTFVSLDCIANEKDKVRTGDVFLITTAWSQWLALAQTGHFAHSGLIYKFSELHLDFLPERFRQQCEYWLDRGHIREGTVLVLEMTNHPREWDKHCDGNYPDHWKWPAGQEPFRPPKTARPKHKNNGTRLTTLDSYCENECTKGFYGNHTLIAVRANKAPRNKDFWIGFFKYMDEKVDTKYANGRTLGKVLCSVLCPNIFKDRKKLFCSEFVALFHQYIKLIQCNPSQVIPSDYGHRKGCCSIQYLCCCLAYIYDARTFKYYNLSSENILDAKDCPLYILDNASVKQHIRKVREQDMVIAETVSGSRASSAANSPRETDEAASVSLPDIHELALTRKNNSVSADILRLRYRPSITADIQRMSLRRKREYLSADEAEYMCKINSAPLEPFFVELCKTSSVSSV